MTVKQLSAKNFWTHSPMFNSAQLLTLFANSSSLSEGAGMCSPYTIYREQPAKRDETTQAFQYLMSRSGEELARLVLCLESNRRPSLSNYLLNEGGRSHRDDRSFSHQSL